ncbi:MAG: hypothetical protein U0Q16_21080 [Bryobacteraceae bacterium]
MRPVLLLCAATVACAIEIAPIQIGFSGNIGQEDADVLFATEGRRFFRDSVELTPGFRIRFPGAATAEVSGKEPLGALLHQYIGNDPSRWRENIPHYGAVHYAGLQPGIDVEWRTGIRLPMVRILVAPGADVRRFVVGLSQRDEELRWSNFTSSVVVWSAGLTFDKLTAYQVAKETTRPVAARFENAGGDSFRIAADDPDPGLPLVIEIGPSTAPYLYPSYSMPAPDGSVLVTGTYSRGFLARMKSDGNLAFLTILGERPNLVRASGDGITVSGEAFGGQGGLPTTVNAPRREPDRTADSWIGRFDSLGRLRAATFLGSRLLGLTAGSDGALYFSTLDRVAKWVPGKPQWDFEVPMRSVQSLAVGAEGMLSFAAFAAPGLPVTPGAMQQQPQGRHDIYAGTLNASTGALLMATYLPVFGKSPADVSASPYVTLAPNGNLWIASVISTVDGARAQTLVALAANGSRILYSAAFPSLPFLSFDSRGNTLVAISQAPDGLGATASATRRSPCRETLYLRTLSPEGVVLEGSYVGVSAGQIASFDGPDRLFVYPSPYSVTGLSVERVDPYPAPKRELACIVHAASRQLRGFGGGAPLAPGGLYTIIGNQLGPLTEAVSTEMPSSLGEVEVRVGGKAVPLYSVQQGLITFYLPETTTPQNAELEIVERGTVIAKTTVDIGAFPDFATLSADGSGYGTAVATNRDGTVNSRENPAQWGWPISIYGTGPLPPGTQWTLSQVRSGRTLEVLTPESSGPVQGAAQGTTRITLRLPSNGATGFGSGWALVYPMLPGRAPATVIYVGPLI